MASSETLKTVTGINKASTSIGTKKAQGGTAWVGLDGKTYTSPDTNDGLTKFTGTFEETTPTRNSKYAYTDSLSDSSKDMINTALGSLGVDYSNMTDKEKVSALQKYAFQNGYSNNSTQYGTYLGNSLSAVGMKVKNGQIVWDTSSDAYKNYVNQQNLNNISQSLKDIYTGYEGQIGSLYDGYEKYAQNIYDQQNLITNGQYDANASGYYAQYKQNQRNLKNQMSANGLTGGASESAQLGVLNNYATNYANNESARGTALNNNGLEYNKMLADNYSNRINALQGLYTNAADTEANFQSNWKTADHTLENDKNLAKYNSDLSVSEYKKKEQIATKLAKANATEVAKTNNSLYKSKKNSGGYFYLDGSGYLRWTPSEELASQKGGVKAGSAKSYTALLEAWQTTAVYNAENGKGKVLSV